MAWSVSKTHPRSLLPLLILALLGAILLLTATRHGVGLSPDSVVYVAAARNLSQGAGLTLPFGNEINGPLAHHAPLYPTLLAVVGQLSGDPLPAARGVQALLFAANILLVAWLVAQITPGGLVWPFLAAFFVLISPPLFSLHTMAWTEALFLFLSFSGLAGLAAFLQRPTWPRLLLTAVLLSLALLTRYAGLAVIGTAVFAILLLPAWSWRRRFAYALIFAALALFPFLLWMLNSQDSGGAIRSLNFHPVGLSHFQQGLNSVAGWFLIPDSWPTLLKAGLLILLFLALAAAFYLDQRRQTASLRSLNDRPPLLLVLLLFATFYPLFLLLSISFFDANTPLDDRILAPLIITLIILCTYAASLAWRATRRPWFSLAPLLVLAFLLASGQMVRSADWWRSGYDQGIGFNSLAWQHSPLIENARQLAVGTLLYANAPEPLNLHTGRPVLRLPRKFESVSQQVNDQYGAEMARLQARLRQEQGVVVYFTALQPPTLPTQTEIAEDLALIPLVQAADGLIYGLDR